LLIVGEGDLEENGAKKAWLITFCDLISLLLTFFILIYTQVFIKKTIPPENNQVIEKQPSLNVDSYFLPNNNLINLNLLSKVLNYKLSLLATIDYIDVVFNNKHISIFVDLERLYENEINKKIFLELVSNFFISDVTIAIHTQDNIIDFERAQKLRSMLNEYTSNINIILNSSLPVKTNLTGGSIGLISLESN
jgi:hypothetical protein